MTQIERVARQPDGDVLEVVLAGAVDDELFDGHVIQLTAAVSIEQVFVACRGTAGRAEELSSRSRGGSRQSRLRRRTCATGGCGGGSALERRGRWRQVAAAAEDEAAEREAEPEGAERERADRDRLAPDREPLPVPERGLLLLGQLLPAPLLPQGAAGLEAQVEVVEDLGRLFGHGASV